MAESTEKAANFDRLASTAHPRPSWRRASAWCSLACGSGRRRQVHTTEPHSPHCRTARKRCPTRPESAQNRGTMSLLNRTRCAPRLTRLPTNASIGDMRGITVASPPPIRGFADAQQLHACNPSGTFLWRRCNPTDAHPSRGRCAAGRTRRIPAAFPPHPGQNAKELSTFSTFARPIPFNAADSAPPFSAEYRHLTPPRTAAMDARRLAEGGSRLQQRSPARAATGTGAHDDR